ncbi:hypothetical protein ACNKHS_20265 [Shigella flexneri]
MLTGFTVGFALFYEVGFVLMLPLVFTIAAAADIRCCWLRVCRMAAALSVTHGFLPPHPGPTAIATIFHADMGKTLLFGTISGNANGNSGWSYLCPLPEGIDSLSAEGLYSAGT